MNKMFLLWKWRFAFLPLAATLLCLLFSSRCDTKLQSANICPLLGSLWNPLQVSTDHSQLGGSFCCIVTSPGILLHRGMQALMCLWGEEERVYFREITEYIEASSLVISDLRRAFMSIVLEGFDITLCQMTKVLSLSSSACSTFPAPRLCKLCYLLSAALRGRLQGEVCLGWLLWLPTTGTDHQPWHSTPCLRPSSSDPLRITEVSCQICKGSVMCNTWISSKQKPLVFSSS